MRRHEFEQFKKGTCLGLLADCAYYCSQTNQISDYEFMRLDNFCDYLYDFFNTYEVKGGKL